MPFFENAKDFTITGGTFNVIHGDLNQYHNHRSTFVAHSYNDNGFPDDRNSQRNFPHYGSQPVHHGSQPMHHGSQPGHYGSQPGHDDYAAHRGSWRRHQERGPYESAEYYYDDNRGRRFQGNHGGYGDYGTYDGSGDFASYGGRPEDSHGGFEAAMQSPAAHVDLVGGEFMGGRNMNATNDYQATTPGSFNDSQDFESMPSSSSLHDHSSSSLYDHSEALGNPEVAPPTDENATPMGDVDTTASTDASDPADGPTALPETHRPHTAVEKMRMRMASMEIRDSAAATSSEANPSFKFGKLFQPRSSNKS